MAWTVDVTRRDTVTLEESEVERLLEKYLEGFAKGRWVEGTLLREEHYTSHRFDETVGGPDHPDFKLVQAITQLRQELRERKLKK